MTVPSPGARTAPAPPLASSPYTYRMGKTDALLGNVGFTLAVAAISFWAVQALGFFDNVFLGVFIVCIVTAKFAFLGIGIMNHFRTPVAERTADEYADADVSGWGHRTDNSWGRPKH